ncbi:uncharacterized protein ACA1_289380 [Acanthamoeba castellanii str. Neff]|uniref:URB1 N-terminal domain-containing protein n=1 Tax=Acanthamoeba castellanii (strain ATCC 30010 / Neff) TaxID=1257118 RepID=L8HJ45_ACACF|nr:uncharacterized protein ACA1_289380 [Acanthamoeba castellanii str. Neff]ELR25205.1 hypothetical protein ACA1_289380 [Acanthamoeba castellanii str. Neff]
MINSTKGSVEHDKGEAAMSMEELQDDLGGIVHLEHINLCIPEQPKASVFYFEGLGFTRDPFFNVGASTMWCNIGYQQIHLSPGEPQVVRGHIGLVVPSLDDLKKRLVQPKVVDGLQGTKFSWSVHAAGDADARHYIRGFDASKEGYLAVTGPYGNQFRIYEATPEIAVKGNLGIVYLEELCKEGTADKIAAFYRHDYHLSQHFTCLLRRQFIRFCGAFLRTGDLGIVGAVVRKGLFAHLWRDLPHDSLPLAQDLLPVLHKHVLLNPLLPNKLKQYIFTPFAVEQVARLLKAACGRQDVRLQRLVSNFIRDVAATDAGLFGSASTPSNAKAAKALSEAEQEKQRKRERAVVRLLAALDANMDPVQQRLVLQVLKANPRLIPDYVAAPSYSLDPRPTLLWLANVNLFARVLSLPIDHPSGIALPPAPLLGSATAEHEEEERDAENWAVKAAEQAAGTSPVLLERMPFLVSLDLDILRKTVSWEASLKFDHAKRRLTEGKAYKAQKLIWLSIRYLIFAIQLIDKVR